MHHFHAQKEWHRKAMNIDPKNWKCLIMLTRTTRGRSCCTKQQTYRGESCCTNLLAFYRMAQLRLLQEWVDQSTPIITRDTEECSDFLYVFGKFGSLQPSCKEELLKSMWSHTNSTLFSTPYIHDGMESFLVTVYTVNWYNYCWCSKRIMSTVVLICSQQLL